MKGFNMKRLAAIGLGAALVGSALAPVVSAATVKNNVSSIVKTDIISAAGAPVVDVVVGSDAAVSDAVWAGNIAARVAQLATTPGSCTSGEATGKSVSFTVGGTSSTAGQGNTVDTNIVSSLSPAEFNPITTTSTDMPSLVNDASWTYRYNSSNTTISVQEQLDANVSITYQDSASSTAYAPGEMLATVAKGALQYSVDLGDGFPKAALTNMDANSAVNITIPLLGKTYVVDSIASSGTDLVLFSDTSPVTLIPGQSVTVSKESTGKQYTLVLVKLSKTADDTAYVAQFDLKDGNTVVDSKNNISSSTDLKDSFGDKFDDSVYVTFVGADISGLNPYVDVRTGTSRIEIKDGQAFPYSSDSTINTKALWQASITTDSTNVTKITLKSKVAYNKVSGTESDPIKYALKVGGTVVLPNDFAKLEFVGLTTKPMHEILVGDVSGIDGGGIQYPDYKGTVIKVPFMVDTGLDLNTNGDSSPQVVSVSGQDYTFWLGTGTDDNNAKLYYIKGDQSDATTTTGFSSVDVNFGVPSANVSLDLGAYDRDGKQTINYKFAIDTTGTKQELLLAAQSFDIFDKSNVNDELQFYGTDTTESGAIVKTYYVPDEKSLNGIISGTTLDDSDKTYMVATVGLSEDASFTGSLDTNFYVLTGGTGKALDVDSISSDISNYTRDAVNAGWTDSIRQSADYLQTGATVYGTTAVSDGSVFTIEMPEEIRKAELYLGSTSTSTVVSGGADYNGVVVGETKGNVTVTAIAGSCGTGGTAVVISPLSGSLVKTDVQSSSAKSIIVGGQLVNSAAASAIVDSQSLGDLLVSSGDMVAFKSEVTGDIIVAGYTADDTASAAQALISQLETLI